MQKVIYLQQRHAAWHPVSLLLWFIQSELHILPLTRPQASAIANCTKFTLDSPCQALSLSMHTVKMALHKLLNKIANHCRSHNPSQYRASQWSCILQILKAAKDSRYHVFGEVNIAWILHTVARYWHLLSSMQGKRLQRCCFVKVELGIDVGCFWICISWWAMLCKDSQAQQQCVLGSAKTLGRLHATWTQQLHYNIWSSRAACIWARQLNKAYAPKANVRCNSYRHTRDRSKGRPFGKLLAIRHTGSPRQCYSHIEVVCVQKAYAKKQCQWAKAVHHRQV